MLNSEQVARELHVSRMTITRWVRDGRLTPVADNPYTFRRKKLRFARSEVERFKSDRLNARQH